MLFYVNYNHIIKMSYKTRILDKNVIEDTNKNFLYMVTLYTLLTRAFYVTII